MFHGEVVYRDDSAVGCVRAASYGFTLGGPVALAMVESDEQINGPWIERGDWSVDIAGIRYPATASLRPLYDPSAQRIKA